MSEASLPNVDSILFSYEKDSITTIFGAWKQYPKSTSQGIIDLEWFKKIVLIISSNAVKPLITLWIWLSWWLSPWISIRRPDIGHSRPPEYINIIMLISLANIFLPKKLILHNLDVVMDLNYVYQQYVGTLFYPGHSGCLVVAIAKLHVIMQTLS